MFHNFFKKELKLVDEEEESFFDEHDNQYALLTERIPFRLKCQHKTSSCVATLRGINRTRSTSIDKKTNLILLIFQPPEGRKSSFTTEFTGRELGEISLNVLRNGSHGCSKILIFSPFPPLTNTLY